MSEFDAVVAGHICLDIIPDLNNIEAGHFLQVFQPGRLLEIGAAAFSTGGAVSNTGLALNKLGIKTRLIGKIGADLFGQAVQQVIRSYGTDLADGMIVGKDSPTSYTLIISPPGIDRMFLHCAGANGTFVSGDINFDQIAQTRLFHLGYPPLLKRMYENEGVLLGAAYYRAKGKGLTTSLDMCLPDPASPAGKDIWLPVLTRVLRFVDIFLPSIEETLFTLRRATYNELMQKAPNGDILPLITPELLSDLSEELIKIKGVKIVVLKLGNRGLYLPTAGAEQIAAIGHAAPPDPAAWANKEIWSPCFKANLVGTTGSGDATIAGFLGALLRGLSPEDAVNAAVAVGACNVEAADALSGLRTWDETMQRIAAGWEKHPLTVDAPGWQFDAAHNIWYKA